MKILIASDFYIPTINGVVTSVMNLKEGLELLGHEVRVLALSREGKSYYKNGVYYIDSIDASRIYPDARFIIPNKRKERREIMEWKPDLIHTQNEFSTFYIARKIARDLSVPMVHTYHTVYEDYTHYFFRSKMFGCMMVAFCTKLLGRNVNCIIAPTNKISNIVNNHGVQCPVSIISSGISLEQFHTPVAEEELNKCKKRLQIPEGQFVLLSVSRIGKEKKVEDLIHFINGLQDPTISLVIVGDGPEKAKLQKLVENFGLQAQVKFTGMVQPHEVPLYYQLADVFVSASTSEAQGLTYIESLASGTPILCREDECLQGVLEEGITGYSFVEEKDFLEKLKLMRNPERLEQMSTTAVESSQQYTRDTFVENVLHVYEKYYRQCGYVKTKVSVGKRIPFYRKRRIYN
ncbi:MAG: glycosyltransferase [Eubacteriales bacterium]